MGVPEIIRNFEFTTILLTSKKHILSISTLFLVIQSIFTALEPQMNKKTRFSSCLSVLNNNVQNGDLPKLGHKYVSSSQEFNKAVTMQADLLTKLSIQTIT